MDLQRLTRPLGEINDKDTQFTAGVKKYQEFVLSGAIIFIVMAVYFIYAYTGGLARTGTWRFGLCKVFAEQYESYPTSIKMLVAEERQNSALIEYLATNAYGAQVSHEMECFYNVTPQGVRLSRVTVDGGSLNLLENGNRPRPGNSDGNVAAPDYQAISNLYKSPDADSGITNKVAQIHIDEFNKSIGVIVSSDELDLTMPDYSVYEIERIQNLEELKYN